MLTDLFPPLTPARRSEVALGRRQLYILPTRHGWWFAAVLLVLLLAAINYGNGLGYALTFLLAALAVVSMLYTHRNLLRLRLSQSTCEPAFASESAVFSVCLTNDAPVPRLNVCVERDKTVVACVDIAPGETRRVELAVPTKTRGHIAAPVFIVSTSFPFGILYSWSRRVAFAQRCLVYPRPASGATMAMATAETYSTDQRPQSDGDDFVGVREYRPGDSPHHIDWRAVARGQGWHTKQFGGGTQTSTVFDWEMLAGLPPEERLSILCRWILDAERAEMQYGLRLPGNEIAPGHGETHQHRCLSALALFPAPS